MQIVTKPTRISKSGLEAILDPIDMTMSQYYQEPLCLEPLDCDPDKDGHKSDHKIVLTKPINILNNKSARITKTIKTRPITHSGIKQMQNWLITHSWEHVFNAESSHAKAKNFQDTLVNKFNEIFTEKVTKISSVDEPWMTEKLKKIRSQKKMNLP